MTMICDQCGMVGIRWVGPLSDLTHTECPHCGGRNCQRVDDDGEDRESEREVDSCDGARLEQGGEHDPVA